MEEQNRMFGDAIRKQGKLLDDAIKQYSERNAKMFEDAIRQFSLSNSKMINDAFRRQKQIFDDSLKRQGQIIDDAIKQVRESNWNVSADSSIRAAKNVKKKRKR